MATTQLSDVVIPEVYASYGVLDALRPPVMTGVD